MKQAYFWLIYAKQDEVMYAFSKSRGMAHIPDLLDKVWEGTILTDGYAAQSVYEATAKNYQRSFIFLYA